MKISKSALLALFAVYIAGCSSDKVSFATLEDARAQARANAEVNARAYARENPRMTGFDIVGHGDSTQTEACPQGDGWASLSIMKADPNTRDERGRPVIDKFKVKCSTVSANLGCYLEDDFKTKPFADQENQCDKTLPFPLPKVVGTK
jgi:hypothetical protein